MRFGVGSAQAATWTSASTPVPGAPISGYNWVAGTWQWSGAEWIWVAGHYIAC